mmetsp:Transcript_78351/g.208022  ORF Transcript_78351/g.208022 Transcript_78351/m.208022 type:complete len:181 (-) Transcript_78351:137-679(-)|eukprot:CAMPEP_0171200206 /NCGR_PEP_ID=MMETSP0790-20130122/23861_1 /TAXON_ID=2925 /ORGANISM="Alexandrium catenella, Strain OF101" /LENGTH=180 /DNA_ID=CAMNT_0011665579 /DNA_START=31 /DNA_END=573 /DNA_ORIENTATION=+
MAPSPSCFALCSAVHHVNAFEDLFEEDDYGAAGHRYRFIRLDRGLGRSSSEHDSSDNGVESDNTSETGETGSGEDEEDEQHEQVFDIERLRWENREEQRLEQLLADACRGGPFRRISELRMAIDDAETVGVSAAKLEAARRVLRARSSPGLAGAIAWPESPSGGLQYFGSVHRVRAMPAW